MTTGAQEPAGEPARPVWMLTPLDKVGPLRFGMSADQVEQALPDARELSRFQADPFSPEILGLGRPLHRRRGRPHPEMRMDGPPMALPGLPSRLAFRRARTELARMAPAVLVPRQPALIHDPLYAEPRVKQRPTRTRPVVQRSLSLLLSQESVLPLSRGGAFLSCPGPVDLGVLFPHLAGVIVEEVTAAAGLLLLLARARATAAACPACGTVSGRVHSRYPRTLADAAIGGRQAVILLTVRRAYRPAWAPALVPVGWW